MHNYNTKLAFAKELKNAEPAENDFFDILCGYKNWFSPNLNIEQSQEHERIFWDYKIKDTNNSIIADIELKAHPESTIREYYDEPFEVTNIKDLGWIFLENCDYLVRAIKDKDDKIMSYEVYKWKNELQDLIFTVLEELLGENWRQRIETRDLPFFIYSKDKKWKLLREPKEGKWLLFRSCAYNKNLEIQADDLLEYQTCLDCIFLKNIA